VSEDNSECVRYGISISKRIGEMFFWDKGSLSFERCVAEYTLSRPYGNFNRKTHIPYVTFGASTTD